MAFKCGALGNTSLVNISAGCSPSSPGPRLPASPQGQLGLKLGGHNLHWKQIPCSLGLRCAMSREDGGISTGPLPLCLCII